MTMRATVSRNTVSDPDDWNQPDVPSFDETGEVVACRAWSKMRRSISDNGKVAVIEDMRAMVPLDADVEEEDRLVIKDRRGNTLFGGPVAVETKTPAGGSGSSPDHYELALTRHL